MRLGINRLLKKTRKPLLYISIGVIVFFILIILFISPLTKYTIEHKSIQYTGRKIKMDWVYVNPFTGYLHFRNLKIFEKGNDSLFISVNTMSLDVALSKLFSQTYEITSITFEGIYGVIIQNKLHYNYSDLIERITNVAEPNRTKEPVHFNIGKVVIKDGHLRYMDLLTPIDYSIKKINFISSGKNWDVDTISGTLSFMPEVGSGELSSAFELNIKSLDYKAKVILKKLNLGIIGQYLKPMMNFGTFSANMDADIKAIGNLNSERDIDLVGKIAFNNFYFGKNAKESYLSFDKLSISTKRLAPNKHIYFLDTVMLTNPYFKFERYDNLDNLQKIFGTSGANVKIVNNRIGSFNLIIELAKYMKAIFKDFLKSEYKINHLELKNGDFHFNDYSIQESYKTALTPFTVKADSLNSQQQWAQIFLESDIKPYGKLTASASMNPKDNRDFNIIYKLENIPATAFNPYLINYTSYPLDRGVIEVIGAFDQVISHLPVTTHFNNSSI